MQNVGFPPINSDEASFAYNGYSIAQTGKDEYGVVMPSRFKAFGENKLPVTIYTIAAFVKVLGFNSFTSRLPFMLIGITAPLLFYYVGKKFFNNNIIALSAAFLASLSPWIQIMSRHIHENLIILVLTSFVIVLFTQLLQKVTWKQILFLALLNGISLFTYHIGKMLAVYFFLTLTAILVYKKQKADFIAKAGVIFLIPILFFLVTEFQNPSTRVSNLLFINNSGFTSSIEELRSEHNSRIIHNKGSQSLITLSQKYLTYFSPEFLIINGDNNDRFGMKGISPITPVTFILFIIGLYFVYKNKEPYRYILISLLLVAPLTASLSWQDYSLTRSFLLIIPILLLASYGGYHLIASIKQTYIKWGALLVVLSGYVFFTFYSWDFYFNHYPKKRDAVYAWQGGYEGLNTYIANHYNDTNQFYITKKLGQPYIFTLFFMKFPPAQYQKEAELTAPDEYGFGQVERFDKFTFSFKQPEENEDAVYVGYPEEFAGSGIDESKFEKITYNNEEIFWIYNSSTK